MDTFIRACTLKHWSTHLVTLIDARRYTFQVIRLPARNQPVVPPSNRTCAWIFFLLRLSLFRSSFSDSSHLCFSFVHIFGSLTSKLPSTIASCFDCLCFLYFLYFLCFLYFLYFLCLLSLLCLLCLLYFVVRPCASLYFVVLRCTSLYFVLRCKSLCFVVLRCTSSLYFVVVLRHRTSSSSSVVGRR